MQKDVRERFECNEEHIIALKKNVQTIWNCLIIIAIIFILFFILCWYLSDEIKERSLLRDMELGIAEFKEKKIEQKCIYADEITVQYTNEYYPLTMTVLTQNDTLINFTKFESHLSEKLKIINYSCIEWMNITV